MATSPVYDGIADNGLNFALPQFLLRFVAGMVVVLVARHYDVRDDNVAYCPAARMSSSAARKGLAKP